MNKLRYCWSELQPKYTAQTAIEAAQVRLGEHRHVSRNAVDKLDMTAKLNIQQINDMADHLVAATLQYS